MMVHPPASSDYGGCGEGQVKTQMEVVYVFWLRQLKRYLRSRARLFGCFVQPFMFLLGLGIGLGSTFRNAGEGNYIQFLTPGIIGMTILYAAAFSGSELIWDRQVGFLREIFVAPVPRLLIMAGRIAGGITVAVLQGVVVFLLCCCLGFRPMLGVALLSSFLLMFLIAVVFTAFSTSIASLIESFHGFQSVINFVVMPMFFLSGALYPLSTVPKCMRVLTAFNLFSYGVDGLRWSLLGTSHFGAVIDIAVLTLSAAAFVCLGAYLFSRIQF
jgi:ABC-2 type transport system permease protein